MHHSGVVQACAAGNTFWLSGNSWPLYFLAEGEGHVVVSVTHRLKSVSYTHLTLPTKRIV